MRGRSADALGMAAISDVLGKALDDLGLMSKAKKYQIFSLWSKVVGDISRHAKPRRLSGDTLFVATASSAWSQELTFMRQSILEKVNRALGGEYVREIRFSEHLWEPSEDRPAGHHRLSASEFGEGRIATELIRDSVLADRAQRFSRAMTRRTQYLLRRGYVVCRTCGCLYPSAKRGCPYCRVKKEFLAKERAIAILDKAPHLSVDEILNLIGSQDRSLVERVRRDLESRCLNLARNAAGRGSTTRQGDAEVTQVILKLAALRTGKPAEELTPDELEKAVGRRLFLAAKKGSMCSRGSTSGARP